MNLIMLSSTKCVSLTSIPAMLKIAFEITSMWFFHNFSSIMTPKIWLNFPSLTLKWPRYFYSNWCPIERGAMELPKKTTFPPEFCNEICTIYVWTIKNHNSEKKNQNVVPFQNGGQITNFYFASFRFWSKFEKPLSQRNFSMKFGSK